MIIQCFKFKQPDLATGVLLVACFLLTGLSQVWAVEYFPPDHQYDAMLPVPRDSFGFEVGEQHLLPEQIDRYLEKLALYSKKINYQVIGRSHQFKPQVLLTVSSEENIANIEQILENNRHSVVADADKKLVVWLSFGVHGDEASGTNASVLLAYFLAAVQSEKWERLFDDTIIIIEPAANPDGLGQFATWVNSKKGNSPVVDNGTLEHHEPWPGSRTNHYAFDLNRDWLLLTQPESVNRVRWFYYWHPHVLADFHGMESSEHYFFQPGVPARKHPMIPKENYRLNTLLTQHHASIFDARGVLYFSGERFDDFYFGKGSTYPDINGSVGILFEQPATKGHVKQLKARTLRFSDGIKNQLDAALATLESSFEHRRKLKQYKKSFFEAAVNDAQKDKKNRAIIFGDRFDRSRTLSMVHWMQQHQIIVHRLKKAVTIDGQTFKPEFAFIIPMMQKQYRLIKALFDQSTQFKEGIFYDVSAWHAAMAYNIPFSHIGRGDYNDTLLGRTFVKKPAIKPVESSPVGYLVPWHESSAAPVLAHLVKNDVDVRFALKPLTIKQSKRTYRFRPGALFVPAAQNHPALLALLREAEKRFALPWLSLKSGLSAEGIDLGSPSFRHIQKPRIALLANDFIDPNEFGAIWHYIDKQLGYPVSLFALDDNNAKQLQQYTHIVSVSWSGAGLKDDLQDKLIQWIKDGGSFIGIAAGGAWLDKYDNTFINVIRANDGEDYSRLTYKDKEAFLAANVIGGAIVESSIDTSHPLAFGTSRDTVYSLKRGTTFYRMPPAPFVTVAKYQKKALVNGHIAKHLQEKINGSAMMIGTPYERGHITVFADHPNFRGYWAGNNKLMSNALFFSANYNEK